MVDVMERTWNPDAAAREEVLRRFRASCEAQAPLRGAEIAAQMPGLKPRWVQGIIAQERKDRKAEAKESAKRTKAASAAQPTTEAPAKPRRPRAENARAKDEAAPTRAPRANGSGVVVAWGAFALGLVVSVASNIGHVIVVVRPEEELVRVASMAMAALWPLLLAVAVEVVSRVSWPRSWQWWLPGYAGTIVVGLIAFVISYQHLHGLLLAFGESDLTALLGPIALDLTIVVAGVALLAIGESRKAEAAAA